MKTFVTLLIIASAASACDKPVDTTETTSSTVKADNTKTNLRDNSAAAAVTPMDQGNNPADLATTQAIRKAVMADEALSTTAKNVKIITNNGTITLRGPVQTDAERKSVEAMALAAAGTNRVDDQLDIAVKQ